MGNYFARQVLDKAPQPASPEYYSDYSGEGPWYKCLPDSVVPPRVAKKGVAGPNLKPTTLPALVKAGAEKKADCPMLLVERPNGQPPPLQDDGKAPPALPVAEWSGWTYKSCYDDVRSAAKAMISLGFKEYDSVNIWGFNSPEWVMGALAANFAGGKVAGLYPTDTPETAAYKVVHSGGSILLIEDEGKVKKLVAALKTNGQATAIKAIVVWGFAPEAGKTIDIAGCGSVPMISWMALVDQGRALPDDEMEKRVAAIQPGNCAALIYTSGTTGEPKAVMISHDNIIFEAWCVINILGDSVGLFQTAEQERILSYLPQSHVAGKMVDIASPILSAALTPSHTTVFFARPYDLKVGAIKDRLNAARPTVFLGVPLVWEKIADKLRALGANNTGVKKSLVDWAKGVALDHSKACIMGGDGKYPFGYGLADTLVLSNVKGALGLDKCKFGFTGAAPIRVDTLEYFGALGLNINEVYGMSECTGACTFSVDEAHAWGSCGWEMPGVEVRSFKVDPTDFNKKVECPKAPNLDAVNDEEFQGELCFRGRNIMMGYMANPDLGDEHVKEIEKKTAETIDAEGWLHSGDKGMITEQGMVKITGRYKELIIGEGGENIAPVPIEDHVKKMCDGINEVMMVGDKRKYNVALVTLKAIAEDKDDLDAGATRVNPAVKTISAAMDDQTWIEAVTKAFESANKNGQVCPNNAFKIQKFTILPTNFSEEKGQLTPTKKLKRKTIETEYAAIIDKMYKEDGVYIRYS